VLEQQHDHSCILGLVLSHFAFIMQRDGEWKPFLSLLQFVLRPEVENTCDQCYESSDYGMLEQQHDHSCILGLVLSHFAFIMQRDGE